MDSRSLIYVSVLILTCIYAGKPRCGFLGLSVESPKQPCPGSWGYLAPPSWFLNVFL